MNSSDYVFVSDTDNHRIQVFTPGGTYVTQWGSYGSGNGQFWWPYSIAVNNSDFVYCADTYNNRIQVFTPSGTYVTQWGSFGSGNGLFMYPRGIAVNGSGYSYVADTGNDRIQIFSPSAEPPIPPVARFIVNTTTGTAPLTVRFNDTSTNSPTSWNWSFGDGTWSNTTVSGARNVTHTYTIPAAYTARLTVTNTGGSSSTSPGTTITVNTPVVRGITTAGIYRNGNFYLRNTNGAGNADLVFGYGISTDTPLVGDWNGDGTDTVGIYRNGNFYLRNTNGAGNADLVFGYGIIHRYSLGR